MVTKMETDMAPTTNQRPQPQQNDEVVAARLRWARALSRLGQATATALRDYRL